MRHPRGRSLGSLELFSESTAKVSSPKRRPVPAPTPSLSSVPQESLQSSARSVELWLAVHLPQFMLDALRSEALSAQTGFPVTAPSIADSPAIPSAAEPLVAVVDLDHGGKVVRDCNAQAMSAGVVPGMAINSALALAPALQSLARDVRRERALLESIAMLGL